MLISPVHLDPAGPAEGEVFLYDPDCNPCVSQEENSISANLNQIPSVSQAG